MTEIKRIAVLTSGGDAAGMNPCIRSVVRTAMAHGIDTYGVEYGYQGLIDNNIAHLNSRAVSGIINRGGTILYTARCKEFAESKGREKAYKNLRKHKVDALVVIGGDGSYTGAEEFYREMRFPVICIPGTIDNDIAGTEYTIGYDTAVNVAVEAIDKIRDTATSHGRLFVVEVMGRHAGYIALEVGIAAGAEEIIMPEVPADLDAIVDTIESGRARGKRSSIIVVAEGSQFGGGEEVAKMIEGKTGYTIRYTILGHMQRGGSPTCRERLMASRFGYEAVMGLLTKRYGTAVGIMKGEITYTPLADAIKKLPRIRAADLAMLKALSK